jgi:hypothetical protein
MPHATRGHLNRPSKKINSPQRTPNAPGDSGWAFRSSAPTVWPSPNEKPDRYAAAICIRVRSDCLLLGYSVGEAAACPCCEGRDGPQTLSGCHEVFVERLLLFLLGCLFRLLRFLRFLGHVALRGPQKFTQCKSTIDVHASRIHHNCKIDTARFENGKRASRLRPNEALA